MGLINITNKINIFITIIIVSNKYISKISNEIGSNGRLYITTGDIESWLSKIQKKKWRLIHPPSHLHYFSKKTITQLLEASDFIVEKI